MLYEIIDCIFQWQKFIGNNPTYLICINIKIVMRNNITQAFYLFPRYCRIHGKQVPMSNLVKIFKTLANRNKQHACSIKQNHTSLTAKEIVNRVDILSPFLKFFYRRAYVLKNVKGKFFFLRR